MPSIQALSLVSGALYMSVVLEYMPNHFYTNTLTDTNDIGRMSIIGIMFSKELLWVIY